MFSPGVRLFLIAAAVGLGAMQLLQHRIQGAFMLAAGALLAWGYFRHGTIHSAFAAWRRGDMLRVRQLLQAVPEPARLTVEDRAYYHWLRGLTLAEDGQLGSAKTELLAAAEGRLRTENDRSLVHCHLAALALQAKEFSIVDGYLDQARRLAHHSEVGDMIRRLQEQLNDAAAVRNPAADAEQ